MSFVQRRLNFTFTLVNNKQGQQVNFTGTSSNTTTVSGLRASCKILKAGFPQMGRAIMRIYGMTLDTMNDISTLGQRVFQQPLNQVLIQAGDAGGGMAIAFWGIIQDAYIDFSEAPNVALQVEAFTESGLAVLPKVPVSITGAADAVTILSGLATAGGLAFENNGVSGVTIPNLYLWGSPLQQIRDMAEQLKYTIGVGIVGESPGGTLALWNLNQGRNGVAPLISSEDGSMIGYPSYTPNGIMVQSVYNPSIAFQKSVVVKSQFLPAANRTWQVFGIDHDLDAMLPGGKWQTTVQAFDPETGTIPLQR